MNFKIRNMTIDDINSVQDIAEKSWLATYAGIIPEEIQKRFLKAAYSDEMMHKRLNHSLFLVAETDSGVVGFANFSFANYQGETNLGAIYLYPGQQSRGIGTAMLQEGINQLDGVVSISVEVEKDNAIGKSFYEAKGFETVDEYDDEIDGHILKTILMTLNLS